MNTENFDISTEILKGMHFCSLQKCIPFKNFCNFAEIETGYDQTDVTLKKMQHTFRVY